MLIVAGCTADDTSVERERAVQVVGLMEMTDVDGPNPTTSKDVEYWTAKGLADGDTATVMAGIRSRLVAAGFDVAEVEDLSDDGQVVGAWQDDVAVQAAVYARVGVNDAPLGRRWVQVGVASTNADLAWAAAP